MVTQTLRAWMSASSWTVAGHVLHLGGFAQFSQESHNFDAQTYREYLMDAAIGRLRDHSRWLVDRFSGVVAFPRANG